MFLGKLQIFLVEIELLLSILFTHLLKVLLPSDLTTLSETFNIGFTGTQKLMPFSNFDKLVY